MAVGSSEGQIRFWHNEKHSADHRVVTQRFSRSCQDDTKISTVPVTPVDSFVSNRHLRNISFIKIDVQGYELAVCEGMKDTLERFPETCVCLEDSPDALVELRFEPGKILDFFRSRGYQLDVLRRAAPQVVADLVQGRLRRSALFEACPGLEECASMPKSSRPRATRLKRTGNRSSRSRPLQPGTRDATNFAQLVRLHA